MTLPSFFAAPISAGVTASGGGAAAITRVENAAPAKAAPTPASTWRREIPGCFMFSFPALLAKLGTPDPPHYSYGWPAVHRRQRLAMAATPKCYCAGQAAPVFTQASTN